MAPSSNENNPYLAQVDRREPEPYNVSIVGCEGDQCPVIVTSRGTFYARFGEVECVFGISEDTGALAWENAEGYLPCLVSSFSRGPLQVRISHFCNRVTLDGREYSLLYSRVSKTNRSAAAIVAPAAPSAELVRLNAAPGPVAPGETQVEDFVTAADRACADARWPDAATLRSAGGWDSNYSRMRNYWNRRLDALAQIETLPDGRLVNAWRAGHIYQLIIMSGLKMNVGVNAYREEFSHDTIGLMITLIEAGDLELARAVLDVHRAPLVAPLDYPDGNYKYSWPWALYLLKTGDSDFVRGNFDVIRAITRCSASQATGPGGIMRLSYALDFPAHWLVDNWSMLTGFAAYRVLCDLLGECEEADWAAKEHDKLLDACNTCIRELAEREAIDYLPASMQHANPPTPDGTSRNSGWATCLHFGRWPWEGWKLGARQEGPLIDWIDATYDWGFAQSRNALPPHSFGAWPGWCTSYNAGFAYAGLRGDRYRSEGIRAYIWMIENAMNGPFSWWEGCDSPNYDSLWQPGPHPARGSGSCPHAWGDSFSRMLLLNSLIDEFADGRVMIGRGVPREWLEPGSEIVVRNVPMCFGRRFGYALKSRPGRVSISFDGDTPAGPLLLDLPYDRTWRVRVDGNEQVASEPLPAGTREVAIEE